MALAVTRRQLYYLKCMIPKAGPTRDVDLFCATFIGIAFIAGATLCFVL